MFHDADRIDVYTDALLSTLDARGGDNMKMVDWRMF